MSLLKPKINNNYFQRNNQTLHTTSLSQIYQNESLPTISNIKIPKINKLYDKHNLNPLKSLNIKNSFKKVLLSPTKESNKIDYITKITVENPPSLNDVEFVLENYIKRNKCNSKYKSYYDMNTMIFYFEEEKMAFDFMKLMFQEKKTNPYYQETKITANLYEKKNKNKFSDINNKIANEVLQRLFYGNGYVKKEKPKKKILGNYNFGIESPFYNVNSKRMKKNFSEINHNEKNLFKKMIKEHKGDKFGYIGYDGKPLKTYKKLKINLLNTSYKPISNFIVREENKNKWMSPLDFKIY